MKKVFIICSVRNATIWQMRRMEQAVQDLESQGCEVHWPPRDTDQNARGIEICRQNMEAIKQADVVWLFYEAGSQGTHFDMGVAFALGKPLVIGHLSEFGIGKSYQRMATEWANNE